MELTPGTILLGKYRIDELIGTGGMGNVVRAAHLFLHQAVAIKILLPQMAESDSTKQRFLREAQATIKLKSEHSVRVMDVGTTPEGLPFMVMEYLEGNDLNQILRHHGPQQPALVVDLMLQACEGIAEAHALEIIHRDIKPSNFFVTRRPDGSMLLKILDFGISKTPVGYDELTGTQMILGTPSYMPPEQMKSGRAADPRSDIWSMGVVMYQLINGRPPFAGESYAELVFKVGLESPEPMMVPLPAGLGEVILRCLQKDPNARHQHVGELARLLAPYASDPISAAQSANRAFRILQNRGGTPGPGGMMGMSSSPLSAGSGASGPIAMTPAQLTPHGHWPTGQSTSSHGNGQVSASARGSRGWMIAGVAGLCVLFGAGGYVISQASRGEAHAPIPAAAPAAPPMAGNAPAAAAGHVPGTPPTVEAPPPVDAAAAPTTADVPRTWHDVPTQPTLGAHPAEAPAPPPPAPPPPAAAVVVAPPGRPAVARPAEPRPTAAKPAKPNKPRRTDSNDDLFNSRK